MQTAAMFANLPIGSVVYGSVLAPPNMPPGMQLIGGELTATPLSPGCLMRYVKTSSGWSAGEMITQQMLQEELASQKNPNLGVANVEVERPSKEEKKQTDEARLQDEVQMLRLPTVTNNLKECGMKAKKGRTLMQSGMFFGIPEARKTQKIQDDISDGATTASVKSDEAVDFTFYSFWELLSVEFSKPIQRKGPFAQRCMNGFHLMRVTLQMCIELFSSFSLPVKPASYVPVALAALVVALGIFHGFRAI